MRFLKLLLVGLLFSNLAIAQVSVEEEIKLGNKYAKMIEAEMGLWKNEAIQSYINQVGQRLVNVLPQPQPYPYTFEIVDQWEPNAFSIPGGHVYISRGLLVVLRNESELAGVLGHEIGHIIQHHSLKIQQKANRVSILALPAVVIGTMYHSERIQNLLLLPVAGLGKAYLSTYSRQNEYEADKVGLQLLAKAGYNSNGLEDALDQLEKEVAVLTDGAQHKFSIFDDHPMTPDRIERLEKEKKKLSLVPAVPDLLSGEAFVTIWEGLLYGPSAKQGLFMKNEFIHPEMDFAITFPQEWIYVNETEAVGAISKDKKSMMVFTFAHEGSKADSLQAATLQNLKAHNHPIISSGTGKANGYYFTQVVYSDAVSQTETKTTLLSWIVRGNYTYIFIGQSTQKIEEAYQKALNTYRDATEEDIKNIRIKEVAVLPYDGQNYAEWSKAKGNVFAEKEFLVANGGASLNDLKGKRVKILKEVPYKK
jgi:predicted Zn-dependent protease